jgi:hypothetical protein
MRDQYKLYVGIMCPGVCVGTFDSLHEAHAAARRQTTKNVYSIMRINEESFQMIVRMAKIEPEDTTCWRQEGF